MLPFLRRGPARLGPDEIPQRTSGGTAVLLDVRDTPERGAGHALGARHLPGVRLPAGAALSPVARGGPVAATCRSRPVAERTAGRGVAATGVVTGGMTARAHEGPQVTCQGGSGGVIP
ncbi:rhodanese-like domain-containing protein [Streptomyces massasporeus]